MEPDESPSRVDGGLPAGTWVEVFTETWQVGLSGWGVDGKPLRIGKPRRGRMLNRVRTYAM